MLRGLIRALGVSADFLIFGISKGEHVEQGVLADFAGLLEKRSESEVAALYGLVRSIIQFREMRE